MDAVKVREIGAFTSSLDPYDLYYMSRVLSGEKPEEELTQQEETLNKKDRGSLIVPFNCRFKLVLTSAKHVIPRIFNCGTLEVEARSKRISQLICGDFVCAVGSSLITLGSVNIVKKKTLELSDDQYLYRFRISILASRLVGDTDLFFNILALKRKLQDAEKLLQQVQSSSESVKRAYSVALRGGSDCTEIKGRFKSSLNDIKVRHREVKGCQLYYLAMRERFENYVESLLQGRLITEQVAEDYRSRI